MSVLQRKAQVGKQEHQARAMTVPKALRMGLAKVADDAFDMALAVIGVTLEKCDVDGALSGVADDTLALMLDGPRGEGGGAVLTHALVSALVQQQTTGRVTATTDPERALTATDAALCAPLLDRLFMRAHGFLETAQDREFLPCFKFGARAENIRLFGLSLEDPEYNVLRLTIDIAGGVAQGNMTLILPVPCTKPQPEHHAAGTEETHSPVTLQDSVLHLKAELSAVLCRVRLPLADVSGLAVGQQLRIPSEAFEAVKVVGIEGETVTTGAMGQVDGLRALMLHGALGEQPETRKPATTGEAYPEAGSNYSDLKLPELDLPTGQTIDPSNLEDLPELPAFDDDAGLGLPDLPNISEEADFADLPGLPDLPDLPDLGDDDGDLPTLGDLTKIGVA